MLFSTCVLLTPGARLKVDEPPSSFLLPPARAKLKYVTATYILPGGTDDVAETTTGNGGRTMWRYRDLAPGNAKRYDQYFLFLQQRPTLLYYTSNTLPALS